MATNLALNDNLLKEAQILGKHKSKKETVNSALSEYIMRRKQVSILESFGTINFDKTYNYKKERKR